jgi:hypothetical protein
MWSGFWGIVCYQHQEVDNVGVMEPRVPCYTACWALAAAQEQRTRSPARRDRRSPRGGGTSRSTLGEGSRTSPFTGYPKASRSFLPRGESHQIPFKIPPWVSRVGKGAVAPAMTYPEDKRRSEFSCIKWVGCCLLSKKVWDGWCQYSRVSTSSSGGPSLLGWYGFA